MMLELFDYSRLVVNPQSPILLNDVKVSMIAALFLFEYLQLAFCKLDKFIAVFSAAYIGAPRPTSSAWQSHA